MVRKTISEARENLDSATTYIPDRYESGVERGVWKEKAESKEAEDKFVEAMRKVLSEGLRKAGIGEATEDDWKDGATEKGAPVIASRIRDALDDYEVNFEPVLDAMVRAIERAPEKSLDPMKNIDERLKPVVKAAIEASE